MVYYETMTHDQLNDEVPQGKAGFREFFVNTFRALPDLRDNIREIVAEDDIVVVYNHHDSHPYRWQVAYTAAHR